MHRFKNQNIKYFRSKRIVFFCAECTAKLLGTHCGACEIAIARDDDSDDEAEIKRRYQQAGQLGLKLQQMADEQEFMRGVTASEDKQMKETIKKLTGFSQTKRFDAMTGVPEFIETIRARNREADRVQQIQLIQQQQAQQQQDQQQQVQQQQEVHQSPFVSFSPIRTPMPIACNEACTQTEIQTTVDAQNQTDPVAQTTIDAQDQTDVFILGRRYE